MAMIMHSRVLISYFFAPDSIPLGFACAGALEQLGFEARGFHSQAEHPLQNYLFKPASKLARIFTGRRTDLSRNLRWSNQRYRQLMLERAVVKFRPELLLVIRGNNFEADTIRRMKDEYRVRTTIGWWVKDPRETGEMLDDAEIYDHYFCIHRLGYQEGRGIHYLPALAVYSDLYRPTWNRSEGGFHHDLVFVGGNNPRREHTLERILDLPLEIYGPGWRQGTRILDRRWMRRFKGSSAWGNALVELYNRSRIVLNVNSWDPSRTGTNLRLFDVPATGAFLLTEETEEARAFFKVGEEIETYESPEELRDKVNFYLQNQKVRERIARRGYERTRLLPTYRDRMRDMLAAIERDVRGR
jgi:spore maturation protein CgeB